MVRRGVQVPMDEDSSLGENVFSWKINVGLWEKFVGLKKPPENTRRTTKIPRFLS